MNLDQKVIDALTCSNYPSKGNVFATMNDVVSPSGGVMVKSGSFTLSADGLTATGGVLTNPGANPTLTITTTSKIKLAHINVSGTSFGSYGKDDGVLADSINSNINGVGSNLSNSINVGLSGKVANGWTGKITQINQTSFNITFTQIGSGDSISGNYHLIM